MGMASLEKAMNSVNAILVKGTTHFFSVLQLDIVIFKLKITFCFIKENVRTNG